jgi:hypothetical protein
MEAQLSQDEVTKATIGSHLIGHAPFKAPGAPECRPMGEEMGGAWEA